MTHSFEKLIDLARPHVKSSSGEEYEGDGWVRFAVLLESKKAQGVAIREYGIPADFQKKYKFKLQKLFSLTPAPYSPYNFGLYSPAAASDSPGSPSAATPTAMACSLSHESEPALSEEGHVWVRLKSTTSEWNDSSLPALSSDKKKKLSLVCNTYFGNAEICCDVERLEDPDYVGLSLSSGISPDVKIGEAYTLNKAISEFIKSIESENIFPSGPFRTGDSIKFSYGGEGEINVIGSGTSTVVFTISIGKECIGCAGKYQAINEKSLEAIRNLLPGLALRRIVLQNEAQARSFYFHQHAHEVFLKENGVKTLDSHFLRVGNIVYIVQPRLKKENLLDWYFKGVLLKKDLNEEVVVLGQKLTVRKFLNVITEKILGDVRKLSEKNLKHEDHSMPPGSNQMLAGYVDAKYANYAIVVDDSGRFVLRYMDPYPVHLKVFGRHPTEDNGRTPYSVFDMFFQDDQSEDALASEGMVSKYFRKFEGYTNPMSIVLKLGSDIIDTIYDDERVSRYHTILEDLEAGISDKYKLLKMVFDEIKNVCSTTFRGEVDLETLESDAIDYWKRRIGSNMLLRLGLHYTKRVSWEQFQKSGSSEKNEAMKKAETIRRLRDGFMLSQTNDEEELIRWTDELLSTKGNNLYQLVNDGKKKFMPDHVLPLLRGVVKTFTESRHYKKLSTSVVKVSEKKGKSTKPTEAGAGTAIGYTNIPGIIHTGIEPTGSKGVFVPIAAFSSPSMDKSPPYLFARPSCQPSVGRFQPSVPYLMKSENTVASSTPSIPIAGRGGGRFPQQVVAKSFFPERRTGKFPNLVYGEPKESSEPYIHCMRHSAWQPELNTIMEQSWTMESKLDGHSCPRWGAGEFQSLILRMQARSCDSYMKRERVVQNCGIIITRGFWPLNSIEAEHSTSFFNKKIYKTDFEPFSVDGVVKTSKCEGGVFESEGLLDIFKQNKRLEDYCRKAFFPWIIDSMSYESKDRFDKIIGQYSNPEYVFDCLVQKIPSVEGGYTIAEPLMVFAFFKMLNDKSNPNLEINSDEAEFFLQMLSILLNMDVFISELNGSDDYGAVGKGKEQVITQLRAYEYENGGLWSVRYTEKMKEDVEKEIAHGNNNWIWLQRTIRGQIEQWTFINDYRSQKKPEKEGGKSYTPERFTGTAAVMGRWSPRLSRKSGNASVPLYSKKDVLSSMRDVHSHVGLPLGSESSADSLTQEEWSLIESFSESPAITHKAHADVSQVLEGQNSSQFIIEKVKDEDDSCSVESSRKKRKQPWGLTTPSTQQAPMQIMSPPAITTGPPGKVY